MNNIFKVWAVLLALVTFSACETYGNYETEYSVIYPLSGEWVVSVYAADNSVVKENVTCNTYNTSANDPDKMWVRMGTAAVAYGILGKVNCDVAAKVFEGGNVQNLVDSKDGETSGTSFTLTNGKIVLEGFETPTGHKADKIEFTLVNSKYPGQVLTVAGFRKTGWAGEDY